MRYIATQGDTEHRPPQVKSQLRKWIEENNLLEKGNPTEAFYDPPWMPGIFRRNELLIPVTQSER